MKKCMMSLLAATLFLGTACLSELDVPFEQESPDVTIDLTTQVQNFEGGINGRGGDDALILTALCNNDPPAQGCNPPVLPDMIPRSIDDPRPTHVGETLEVGDWLEGVEGFDALTDVSEAFSIDPAGEVGIDSPDQVKAVTITSVVFKFSENSLTYPMPPLQMYVGSNIPADQLDDAAALIANDLTDFGVLDEIPAGDTAAHPMSLDAAGKSAMSDALKALDVAIAVQTGVEFPPPGSDAFPKPYGLGTMNATIKAVFTISTDISGLF